MMTFLHIKVTRMVTKVVNNCSRTGPLHGKNRRKRRKEGRGLIARRDAVDYYKNRFISDEINNMESQQQ